MHDKKQPPTPGPWTVEDLHVIDGNILEGRDEAPLCVWTFERTTCVWTFDSEGESWRTACGRRWMLTHGTPAENGVKFCHGCGQAVAGEVSWVDEIVARRQQEPSALPVVAPERHTGAQEPNRQED